MTGADGRFALRLVGNLPNQLRVRAERLGYASYEGPLVEWAELHTRRIEIGLESQALDIEGLTVRPARRCELETGEGPQLASLWEETRKALRVAVWSMSEGALRFRFTRFDRVLDARGRTVLRQDTEDVDRWTRHPFRSVVADSLSAGGYVVDDPDGDGRLFFAPDLEVLLSDAFLATHCLGLVRDGVRMGFEIEPLNPYESGDIEGVLWLEEGTVLPDSLEFRYTGLPLSGQSPLPLGGMIDFARLPTGAWFVQSWLIRMPEIELRARFPGAVRRPELGGLREVGGRVTDVSWPDHRLTLSTEFGSISGQVSVGPGDEPLSGATVRLEGTTHRVDTFDDGSFVLLGILRGTYTIGVDHSQYSSIGVSTARESVIVQANRTVEVGLHTPSATQLLGASCGEPDPEKIPDAGLGSVVGQVRGSDGLPLRFARLQLRVYRFGFPGRTPDHEELTETIEDRFTTTDGYGVYRFCHIEARRPIELEAFLGNARSGLVTKVEWLLDGEVRRVDLALPKGG